MKPLPIVAVLALAGTAAAAQDSIAAKGRAAIVAQRLAPFIEAERAGKGIPAISISIVDGKSVAWARGFGWADSAAGRHASASTVYRVGSVSKLFTDIGIMRLVEAKKLDLDAPVTRYVPDFHPRNPFGGEITLRELTAHRSGLTREPPTGNYFDDTSPSLAATVASLNATTLVYRPGTHSKYSNAGIAVLGDVLERTRGESFYPYLERAVLEPMGLSNSSFRPTPALAPRLAAASMWTLDGRRFPAPTFQLGMGPCGSMYSTVLDLARFAEILLAKGVTPGGARVLSAATIDSMWTPQFAAPGAKTGYGIGFNLGVLDGHRTVGHDGAIYGFATTLLVLPDDSLGVVVTATLDGANAVTDHIARAAIGMVLDARAGRTPATPPATLAPAGDRALQLIGRYVGPRESVDLDEYEGRLYLTPVGGGTPAELRVPAGHDAKLASDFIEDDALSYGERVTEAAAGRLVIGGQSFVRTSVPTRAVVPA
ncbi:MAG: serine hydrolase domain-containing protein, partial [Gemmatimonadaceae bacterium]